MYQDLEKQQFQTKQYQTKQENIYKYLYYSTIFIFTVVFFVGIILYCTSHTDLCLDENYYLINTTIYKYNIKSYSHWWGTNYGGSVVFTYDMITKNITSNLTEFHSCNTLNVIYSKNQNNILKYLDKTFPLGKTMTTYIYQNKSVSDCYIYQPYEPCTSMRMAIAGKIMMFISGCILGAICLEFLLNTSIKTFTRTRHVQY